MSHSILTRHPANPILTHKQVAYPATLIFNAGIEKVDDRYVMIFRNDFGRWGDSNFDGTNLGLAFSRDGVNWEVHPEPVWAMKTDEIRRVYDPRLTRIDGKVYMCFAMDTAHGIRGGIAAVGDDFTKFDILSLSAPDNRNMVLFPEKVNGKFCRLERPFPIYGRGRSEAFEIWFSDSPDLAYWGNTQLVLGSERVPWCNNKIGPGAPPIKTKHGWLAAIHVVDKDEARVLKGWESSPWTKRYTIGLILLDLNEPWKVIGMSSKPLIEPEADYELDGFRGGVLFPGGMILEDDGTVKIYYGAADTVEALATANVDDLVALCEPLE